MKNNNAIKRRGVNSNPDNRFESNTKSFEYIDELSLLYPKHK